MCIYVDENRKDHINDTTQTQKVKLHMDSLIRGSKFQNFRCEYRTWNNLRSKTVKMNDGGSFSREKNNTIYLIWIRNRKQGAKTDFY